MAIAGWAEMLDDKWAQLVIAVAGVCLLAAVGYYLIAKLRGSGDDGGLTASDVLANFRDLHEQGELSDEEYRNIKAKLSARMQQELKRPERKDRKS